jgi:hypothetical protein
MLTSPVNELLGARISSDLVKEIKQEILNHEEVHGVYDIILHNYGPDVLIGSLHVSVNDTMDAYQIHGLTRRISEEMYQRHHIVMTVGIYAIATGEHKRTHLQNVVMNTLRKHSDILQIHGFYYFEDDKRLSVDVIPNDSVKDEAAFGRQLLNELKAVLPDEQITVVIDHNYSE